MVCAWPHVHRDSLLARRPSVKARSARSTALGSNERHTASGGPGKANETLEKHVHAHAHPKRARLAHRSHNPSHLLHRDSQTQILQAYRPHSAYPFLNTASSNLSQAILWSADVACRLGTTRIAASGTTSQIYPNIAPILHKCTPIIGGGLARPF